MKKEFRLNLIASSTLITLLLCLALPLAALAQEGDTPTPTLESSPTASETPTEEATATPEASASETASETATLEPTATETVGSETPKETPSGTPTPTATGSVTETLTPTITPTLGEPLQASDFDTNEVLWCPATVAAPVEGPAMGCTAAYTSLESLRAALAIAPPAMNGTIWIGVDYSSPTFTTFSPGTLGVMADYKLTFKGAWTGPGGTINTADPSILGHRLFVSNWNADLAFSDITITGTGSASPLSITNTKNITLTRMIVSSNGFSPDLSNVAGGAGTGNISITTGDFSSNGGGFSVNSRGTIMLSGVTATGNGSFGAGLTNSGAPSAMGVTVSNSVFSSNGGSNPGLEINSLGNIALTSVTAIGNASLGAELNNNSGTGSITVIAGQFNQNTGGFGLLALSDGTISLAGVTANGNTNGSGASLDNSAAPTAKAVSITSASEFSNNRNHGLVIATKGSVSAKDVTASSNGILGSGGSGAYILNTYGTNPGPGITFTGTNIFTGNYTNGAEVQSFGPISANNIVANSNLNQIGFFVYNNGSVTAQPITLTGSSLFNYNEMGGLWVYSNGKITLNNLTATNTESGSGVYVENNNTGFTSGITVTGTNTFLENYYHGLWLLSNGPISASNVTSEDNGQSNVMGYGVALNNMLSSTTAQNITLSGINSINRNRWTNLYALSRGVISLSSVTANGSETGVGIYADNTNATSPPFTPVPTNSNKAITISGTNVANQNLGWGVIVQSYGAVTTNSITANYNGLTGSGPYGLEILNSGADTPKTVTMNGTNSMSNNGLAGLGIFSDGAIKANNVTASNNGTSTARSGAVIGDGIDGELGAVTLTGTNVFSNNTYAGLIIQSASTVALNSVTASGNSGNYGVEINNSFGGATGTRTVTLTGTNVFSSNFSSGLVVTSPGDINLSSTTAIGNGVGGSFGDGVSLFNAGSPTPKKITVSGINNFSSNFGLGLLASANGLITVNSASASSNGTGGAGGGVWLDNDEAGNTAAAGVTMTGSSCYSLNTGPGLTIHSKGPIAASNINSIANIGDDGAYVTNQNSAAPQKVSLTGMNAFSSNGVAGLAVDASGAVTLSNVSASANLIGAGVVVDQTSYGDPGSPQAFTITGANTMNNNGHSGLVVNSYGSISVASLTANENTMHGAYLTNNSSTTAQKVAFTGANILNENGSTGANVSSNGAITSAASLTANGTTSGAGIALDNRGPGGLGGTGAVTLSGTTTANDNFASGLYVASHGVITTTSVTAVGNGAGGGSHGVQLENWDVTTPVDVKLNGTNKINGNTGGGLYVSTDGAITGSNITASENLSYGATLENFTEGKSFTLTGSNYFNSNSGNGLVVNVYGAATVNNLNASSNGFNGGIVSNVAATTPRNVTLTGTNVFIGNGAAGLALLSDGAVAISNLRAHNNDEHGASLANSTGTAAVTLTGTNSFRNNTFHGLAIITQGAATVNKVTADGNVLDGLHIGSTPGNITLMCGFFTNNQEDGVDVNTPAIFKRVGVVSSGNGSMDIRFTGGGTEVVVRNCP